MRAAADELMRGLFHPSSNRGKQLVVLSGVAIAAIGSAALLDRKPEPGYATSSAGFLACSAFLAAARFIALGPLFFFFKRASARWDLESFGAAGMRPSIPLNVRSLGCVRRIEMAL